MQRARRARVLADLGDGIPRHLHLLDEEVPCISRLQPIAFMRRSPPTTLHTLWRTAGLVDYN